MIKIAITGANGFIGKELCLYFSKLDFEVYALQRDINKTHTTDIQYLQFDLKNPDFKNFPKFDILIHAAYIPYRRGNNSHEYNVKGTKSLLDFCRSKQCKFIQLSSLSSNPRALSVYGKTKFEIEQLFDFKEDLILIPGLVIGNGGLFYSIYNLIKKYSFLPLFAAENQTYTIAITDLCKSIHFLIDTKQSGKKYLLHPVPLRQKEIYKKIAKDLNKKLRMIPIPDFMAILFFEIIEILPFYFGVGKENYLGIRQKITVEKDENFLLKDFDFLNIEKSIRLLD